MTGTTNFINVGIGSGHREKPITDVTVVNRFYSLRDFNVFSQVQNTQYKATCGTSETSPCHQIITDGDTRLLDVTGVANPTIPAGGVGWRMNLQDAGEKVLAESRTFQNRIYFTPYSPEEREYNPEFCVATVGLNRLYIVDAATGKPVVTLATGGGHCAGRQPRIPDRSRSWPAARIAPEAIFVFPASDADDTGRAAGEVPDAVDLPGRPGELRQRAQQPAGADLLGTAWLELNRPGTPDPSGVPARFPEGANRCGTRCEA